MLKVVSYGGFALNDRYELRGRVFAGRGWGLPAVQAQSAERSGAWPLITAVKRPGAVLNLVVRIVGNNRQVLRDALLRALSRRRTRRRSGW